MMMKDGMSEGQRAVAEDAGARCFPVVDGFGAPPAGALGQIGEVEALDTKTARLEVIRRIAEARRKKSPANE